MKLVMLLITNSLFFVMSQSKTLFVISEVRLYESVQFHLPSPSVLLFLTHAHNIRYASSFKKSSGLDAPNKLREHGSPAFQTFKATPYSFILFLSFLPFQPIFSPSPLWNSHGILLNIAKAH